MPGNWTGVDKSVFNGNYASWDAVDFFEREFDRLIDSEAKSTNNIIASNEQLAIESRNQLVNLSNNISDSIHESNNIIDSDLIEFMWLIEQKSDEIISVLHRIEDVLSNPNATEAKEFRERGYRAYSNGWFEMAEEEYLKSIEKNPYDFSVYHSLGNLYFFSSKEPDYQKAAEYYEKAIKFAKPYSEDYATFSAIHLAQSYYYLNDYNSAYAITRDLTRHIPEFLEAKYLHAQYCVLLNKKNEALENIVVLLTENIYYAFFVNNNPIFSSIKSEIEKIYQAFIRKYKSKSDDLISKIDNYVKQSERDQIAGDDLSELNRRCKRIKERYYNDNSLIGYYFSQIHLKKVYLDLLETLKGIWTSKKKDNTKLKFEKMPFMLDCILCVLSFYLTFQLYFYFCNGGEPLGTDIIDEIITIIIILLSCLLGFYYIMWFNDKVISGVLNKLNNILIKSGFIADLLPLDIDVQSKARSSITSVNSLLAMSWAMSGIPFFVFLFYETNLVYPIFGESIFTFITYIVTILSGLAFIFMSTRWIILSFIYYSEHVNKFLGESVINNRLRNLEREIDSV